MSLSPSVRQLWRIDKSTPQKAEVKKQQVEKTWSQSLYSFSLTFNAYISVWTRTHTHTHMQTQTQVYTRTMNTHIHSLTQLHSAHVWNEQGSYLLETHHWARGEVERGRHTAGEEGGEKEGEGGGERLRERERSVTWCACWWLWTRESAADSGGLRLSHYQASSSITPLYWPQQASTTPSTHKYTHTHTHIISILIIIKAWFGKIRVARQTWNMTRG